MKKGVPRFKNQEGFTLIEIIAVLIILAILAAVAVPRYMSVQADARNSAAQAAVAEGKARVNAAAASYILANNGSLPAATDFAASDFGTSAGDFTLAYDVTGTTSIPMTATGVAGTPVAAGTATGTAVLPTT